jgi:hypothetical protein
MSGTQPYFDTEPDIPETQHYECVLCGAEKSLVFGLIERSDVYVAGYRCVDREACSRRARPMRLPETTQPDGQEARDEWI